MLVSCLLAALSLDGLLLLSHVLVATFFSIAAAAAAAGADGSTKVFNSSHAAPVHIMVPADFSLLESLWLTAMPGSGVT